MKVIWNRLIGCVTKGLRAAGRMGKSKEQEDFYKLKKQFDKIAKKTIM